MEADPTAAADDPVGDSSDTDNHSVTGDSPTMPGDPPPDDDPAPGDDTTTGGDPPAADDGSSSGGDPTAGDGELGVCTFVCETDDQCPPPVPGVELVCVDGSCVDLDPPPPPPPPPSCEEVPCEPLAGFESFCASVDGEPLCKLSCRVDTDCHYPGAPDNDGVGCIGIDDNGAPYCDALPCYGAEVGEPCLAGFGSVQFGVCQADGSCKCADDSQCDPNLTCVPEQPE